LNSQLGDSLQAGAFSGLFGSGMAAAHRWAQVQGFRDPGRQALAEAAASVVWMPQPSSLKEPFDRLLIAQALEERLSLVSVDEQIRHYPPPGQGLGGLLWLPRPPAPQAGSSVAGWRLALA
jgi:hypothetical protein